MFKALCNNVDEWCKYLGSGLNYETYGKVFHYSITGNDYRCHDGLIFNNNNPIKLARQVYNQLYFPKADAFSYEGQLVLFFKNIYCFRNDKKVADMINKIQPTAVFMLECYPELLELIDKSISIYKHRDHNINFFSWNLLKYNNPQFRVHMDLETAQKVRHLSFDVIEVQEFLPFKPEQKEMLIQYLCQQKARKRIYTLENVTISVKGNKFRVQSYPNNQNDTQWLIPIISELLKYLDNGQVPKQIATIMNLDTIEIQREARDRFHDLCMLAVTHGRTHNKIMKAMNFNETLVISPHLKQNKFTDGFWNNLMMRGKLKSDKNS